MVKILKEIVEEENNVNVTGQIPEIKKNGSPRDQGPQKQIEKRIDNKMTIRWLKSLKEIVEEENNGYVVVKYVSRNQMGDRAALRGKVALLPRCRKGLAIFPSPAGMSLTKLSLAGNY